MPAANRTASRNPAVPGTSKLKKSKPGNKNKERSAAAGKASSTDDMSTCSSRSSRSESSGITASSVTSSSTRSSRSVSSTSTVSSFSTQGSQKLTRRRQAKPNKLGGSGVVRVPDGQGERPHSCPPHATRRKKKTPDGSQTAREFLESEEGAYIPPEYFKTNLWYTPYRKPFRRVNYCPDAFSDSYQLQHPDLNKGQKLYLWHTAAIYSMSNMKKLQQKNYESVLLRQQAYGFHDPNLYKKYMKYFNSTRKRQFEADPTVWREPPKTPVTLRQRDWALTRAFSSASYPYHHPMDHEDGVDDQKNDTGRSTESSDSTPRPPTKRDNRPKSSKGRTRGMPQEKRSEPSPRRASISSNGSSSSSDSSSGSSIVATHVETRRSSSEKSRSPRAAESTDTDDKYTGSDDQSKDQGTPRDSSQQATTDETETEPQSEDGGKVSKPWSNIIEMSDTDDPQVSEEKSDAGANKQSTSDDSGSTKEGVWGSVQDEVTTGDQEESSNSKTKTDSSTEDEARVTGKEDIADEACDDAEDKLLQAGDDKMDSEKHNDDAVDDTASSAEKEPVESQDKLEDTVDSENKGDRTSDSQENTEETSLNSPEKLEETAASQDENQEVSYSQDEFEEVSDSEDKGDASVGKLSETTDSVKDSEDKTQ
ncbi:uncharacterized protein [Ptychodera flava]|uniref:uncharacterized protein n=1 Tax=Ptychodera flava TaxID=63121 RepID=UPI003969F221